MTAFRFSIRLLLVRNLVLAMLLVMGLHLWGTSSARAGFVDVDSHTLDELMSGETLIADGFEFSEFELSGISSGGAIPPNPEAIVITAAVDEDIDQIALIFQLSFNAGSGQTVDGTLAFKISAPDPFTEFISEVGLLVTGSSANGDGLVSIGETVFDEPLGLGVTPVAKLSVGNEENSPVDQLTDIAALPEPAPMLFVRKDISVTGGLNGNAHLSEFYQFYKREPVPEPSSIVLIGIGLASMAIGYRWRRRRRTG